MAIYFELRISMNFRFTLLYSVQSYLPDLKLLAAPRLVRYSGRPPQDSNEMVDHTFTCSLRFSGLNGFDQVCMTLAGIFQSTYVELAINIKIGPRIEASAFCK